MTPIGVLSTLGFSEPRLDQLRSISTQLNIVQERCRTEDDVEAALKAHSSTQILYTYYVPQGVIDTTPDLAWIQLHTAGADHILDNPILKTKTIITTTSGIHTPPIAEYVFASILAHRWQVPQWAPGHREVTWPSGRWNLYSRPELRGSTLGVLGYGSIGREVGRLGQAFGMRVLAMRRSTGRVDEGYVVSGTGDPQGTIPEQFFTPAALLDMLPECDYVVIALPLTEKTTHFISRDALKAMKPTAFLVNIARGPIVDEGALVEALANNWIAGAGLDVFEEEPLPDDSPLWTAENALLTPHVAGFTPQYNERAADLFGENLRRYLSGKDLLNQFHRRLGY